jgi:crotonobetainyl-CoA:carnitine CoA-transferase CaiB-like acyl-CoA transferase
LKKERGREIIYRLISKSDVFVQNFRQGVAAKLGLDYKTLCSYNPKIIYATGSGYGPKGPDSGKPAFDYLGLARSGIMTAMGEPDMPPLAIVGGIADQMGGIVLAYGVLVALIARDRLGIGQEIDVSLLGSMIALQGLHVSASLMLGRDLPRMERAKSENPLWNHYMCKDGTWIVFAVLQSDKSWPQFCKAIGREDLAIDARFKDIDSRAQNCTELIEILDKVLAMKSYKEWSTILDQAGDFIYTRVQNVPDLGSDPQALENDYITNFAHPVLGDMKCVGFPVTLSKTPGAIGLPAPEFGQHTEEVLTEIVGYSWDDIATLKEQEVI